MCIVNLPKSGLYTHCLILPQDNHHLYTRIAVCILYCPIIYNGSVVDIYIKMAHHLSSISVPEWLSIIHNTSVPEWLDF